MKALFFKRTRSAIILVILISCVCRAQSSKFNVNDDVFGMRLFIENKGQFDTELSEDNEVKYAYLFGNERIFFTKRGLVYKMLEMPKLTKQQREEMEDGKLNIEAKPYFVYMNWEQCNPNIEIESTNKQKHYFTYEGIEKCYGYKKLTYKNVYNGIDIEYVIPSDKSFGIKYNIIVHPNADPAQVRIAYTGHVLSVSKNERNDVCIKTPVYEIVEHAPYSFLDDKREVQSAFDLVSDVISFKLTAAIPAGRTLVIDPWVSSTSTLTSNSSAYDVDYDYGGNLFVYGGDLPVKVAKYDNSGNLLWCFPGIVASISWSTSMFIVNTHTGNFAVNRSTGKTYIGSPFFSSFVRLDQAGNYDNYHAVPNTTNPFPECWDMAFQCANDSISAFGGSGRYICYLNQGTPSVSLTYTANAGQDIQSAVFDDNGNLFIHCAPNMIKRINPALTASVWAQPSTFSTLSYGQGKPNYISGVAGHGFNALGVSNNYLYFYDGYNLAAYNKNNGNLITATTVGSQSIKFQGGIAVDDCDNLYLGGDNGNILKYSFNGSSFTAQGSINLNITTTNKYIYDIKLAKNFNALYYCGTGFAGVVGTNVTCASSGICITSLPPTFTTICHGSSAVISIPNVANLSNPSYSVQPGNLTSTNPNFTVSPTTTTNYTVSISGNNASSVLVTQTAIATVSVVPAPSTSVVLANGTCANPTTSSVNINVTFNPSASVNYTTTWSPVPGTVTTVNSGTASGLIPGVNSVTVTSEHGCTTVATFSVPPIPLTASFVIINPSNDYTITCINPNVLLTTSVTNGVPLTYTWFPACTSTLGGPTMSFTQPCTGQVVGTSSTGCIHTETFTIYQNFTSPTIAITPTISNITCAGGSGCFTLTSNLHPNVTTNWYQIVGSNTIYCGAAQGTINIFCAGQPGVYWGESVYNITGCRTTQSIQVTASVGVPVFTVTSPTNFTIGCGSKGITSMQVTSVITSPVPNVPVNYTFMIPPVTGTPTTFNTNPNLNGIIVPGTYVVYVKDLTNNCVSSQSVSIIQNIIAPNINFIQPLPQLTCRDFSMVMTGVSSNTNTQITWTVPAFPGSSVNPTPNATVFTNPAITGATANVVAIGVWTVGAMDNNNFCTSSRTVQINQDIRLPRFTISALTNSIITCKNPDVVIVPIVTPSLAVALVPTYVWHPPVGNAVPGTQFNSTAAGTHTAISTSAVNGCTYSATYAVASDLVAPQINISAPFVIDCDPNPSTIIVPSISGSTAGLTYTWTVPAGAITSNIYGPTLATNKMGNYLVVITNTANGCTAQALFETTEGSIKADFTASSYNGFAPLAVTFTNTSHTSTGATSIISTWGYGNGAVTPTVFNTTQTSATYTAPGTYSVLLMVQKGECVDWEVQMIYVELPSNLEVPNVFTPNGDRSNDIFRLRSSNLKEVYIIIFDRWGTKVYEVTSDTGNFAWDGNNQTGKECSDGTYFYMIKAQGYDGKEFDLKGNVSLFR